MQVCVSLQTDNHANTSPLSFLQAGCPSCCPTNSVKALKAKALCFFVTQWRKTTQTTAAETVQKVDSETQLHTGPREFLPSRPSWLQIHMELAPSDPNSPQLTCRLPGNMDHQSPTWTTIGTMRDSIQGGSSYSLKQYSLMTDKSHLHAQCMTLQEAQLLQTAIADGLCDVLCQLKFC